MIIKQMKCIKLVGKPIKDWCESNCNFIHLSLTDFTIDISMLLSKTFAYVAKILLIFTILWINLVQTVIQETLILSVV